MTASRRDKSDRGKQPATPNRDIAQPLSSGGRESRIPTFRGQRPHSSSTEAMGNRNWRDRNPSSSNCKLPASYGDNANPNTPVEEQELEVTAGWTRPVQPIDYMTDYLEYPSDGSLRTETNSDSNDVDNSANDTATGGPPDATLSSPETPGLCVVVDQHDISGSLPSDKPLTIIEVSPMNSKHSSGGKHHRPQIRTTGHVAHIQKIGESSQSTVKIAHRHQEEQTQVCGPPPQSTQADTRLRNQDKSMPQKLPETDGPNSQKEKDAKSSIVHDESETPPERRPSLPSSTNGCRGSPLDIPNPEVLKARQAVANDSAVAEISSSHALSMDPRPEATACSSDVKGKGSNEPVDVLAKNRFELMLKKLKSEIHHLGSVTTVEGNQKQRLNNSSDSGIGLIQGDALQSDQRNSSTDPVAQPERRPLNPQAREFLSLTPNADQVVEPDQQPPQSWEESSPMQEQASQVNDMFNQGDTVSLAALSALVVNLALRQSTGQIVDNLWPASQSILPPGQPLTGFPPPLGAPELYGFSALPNAGFGLAGNLGYTQNMPLSNAMSGQPQLSVPNGVFTYPTISAYGGPMENLGNTTNIPQGTMPGQPPFNAPTGPAARNTVPRIRYMRRPRGHNTQEQQAYEQNVEERKAVDPRYAIACRWRQLLRYQRARAASSKRWPVGAAA